MEDDLENFFEIKKMRIENEEDTVERLGDYFKSVKAENRQKRLEKMEEKRRLGIITKPKWEIS